MRLRSDFWVSAYIRRCAVEGAEALLRRRGAAEAFFAELRASDDKFGKAVEW